MTDAEAVAVVGMACRVPGAKTPEAFFHMLCRGVDAVRPEAEWPRADATPPARPPHPARVAAPLEDVDLFDAAYFGLTPREAELMDPQQRLFLECCAEALQRAGMDTGGGARVGVYAGAGVNAYFLERVLPRRRVMREEAFQAVASNEKDFLATQVSYRLDLTGPSLTVQTACSTSLVAVALACEALLSHQCDAALAGGSAVKADPGYGSFLEEGGIMADDGRCRAFDARASGTVGGSAVGVVVLKRLSDALADGDHVHAVLRGTALNNDGARKVGYTAPSVEGQAAVVAEAHAVAGVEPETIGFVEAHGTGTRLGDPIEVAALARAFGPNAPRGACALGSLKTNVGHADAAAGVLGLLKAVLAVEQGRIPPTLHFESPNPALRLDETPFFVNRETLPWTASPRRAGVSSFGIGGTNAHVVVEQAPPRAPPPHDARPQVLVLSARTATALDAAAARLADHLDANPHALPDLAWTLQTGRRRLRHRRALAARDAREAAAALRGERRGAWTATGEAEDLRVAFLFPGQGAQHVGMARELYETEAVFRGELDRVCDLFRAHLDADLRDVLYPAPERRDEAERRLRSTLYTQPALFAVEVALARLWISWGIRPAVVLGHSVGDYAAACVAGALALEDAVALVALRARLMEEAPEGAMLAVPLGEDETRALLTGGLALATVNAPGSCVVSGATAEVEALEAALAARGVEAKRLPVARAFHSPLMDVVLDRFEEGVRKLRFRPPAIPVVSSLTGRHVSPEELSDPAYWRRHLRHTVRFGDGVATLLQDDALALLEVGPGRTLASLATRQAARERLVLATLPHAADAQASEAVAAREALARLWLAGARPDWRALHAPHARRKVVAPTYPFERRRYWLDPVPLDAPSADARVRVRGWTRAQPPEPVPPRRWLLVGGDDALAAGLRATGHDVRLASPSRERSDHETLLATLAPRPTHAAYVGGDVAEVEALAAALDEIPLAVVTRGSQDVVGDEPLVHAAVAGAAIARGARVVDADPRARHDSREAAALDAAEPIVALRGPHRWVAHDAPATPRATSPPRRYAIEGPAPPALARLAGESPDAVLRVLRDVRKASPKEVEEALRDEARELARLRADGRPVVLASSGGPVGGLGLAAAQEAARAALAWRVLECDDWSRADPADVADALAVDATHVLVAAREAEARRDARERPDLRVARVGPRDPLEERLVAIWAEAFGFADVGVEDDFFELGGHSLLATRIVSRLRDEFDVEIGLPQLFEARTVADIARVLEALLVEKLEGMSEEDARRALDAT